MSGPTDPHWLQLAVRAYGACLRLYPRTLREAHGEEMRQAFRDRCREVASGRYSAWRLGLEMAPDLLRTSARAHLEGGFSRVPVLGFVLLAAAALALLSQPVWSGGATDAMKAVEAVSKMWQEQREAKRREALVDGLASQLQASGDRASQAAAARLYESLYEQVRFYWGPATGRGWTGEATPQTLKFGEQGAQAASLAGAIVATGGSPSAIAIAAPACRIENGCNVDLALRRLLTTEPDNALGWMLEFKRAAQHADQARMAAAVDGVGRAKYFQTYFDGSRAAMLAALDARDQGDAVELSMHIESLESLPTDDFRNDLRYHCSFAPQVATTAGPWRLVHPEARAACLHLAGLLAASGGVDDAARGWRNLQRAGALTMPDQVSAFRDALWLQKQAWTVGRHPGAGHAWSPWTASDWRRWREAWREGGSEAQVVRRWLRAEGRPVRAPADFQPAM